jgi:hypothetical protein
MYNLDKADRLLKRKLEKDPNFTKKLLEKIKEENPQEFARNMMEEAYGRHIGDEDMYQDAVRNLKWVNGKGSGAKWDKDDLIQRSNVDFNEEGYTPYDYAYAVNAHYADYGTISDDPKYYMDMARNYLRNESYYPERGNERAYYDAQMRSRRYNYNNRYDSYNRYDNYNTYNRYNYDNRYDYENRRSYDRRADRDNDGRYNEGR